MPPEAGEPDLDEGRDPLLDPCFARERERPVPALAGAARVRSLLEAIVSLDERLLDTNTDVFVHFPHPT